VPVAPYTWLLDDYLTASRLNDELYAISGQAFAPNGIGFHAAKPVYKAAVEGLSTITFTASTWTPLGQYGTSFDYKFAVQGDSGGLIGARTDGFNNGCVTFNRLISGGGDPGGAVGGLGLVSTFTTVDTGTGRMVAGLGANGGAAPTTLGTAQVTNASHDTAGYAVDIMDLNTITTANNTGWVFSTQTGPDLVVQQHDGSGATSRVQAHWASVYPSNGATVGSLPSPQTTWTSSSPFTAALMNGSAGIKQLMTMLNMPPVLRVASTASTSTANGTTTTINFPAATYDTYSGWNSSTDVYTVPLSGLYLVYGSTPWASQSAYARTGVEINGTDYFGPIGTAGTSQVIATAKVQVFSLSAGDTIKLVGLQRSGGTLNATAGSILVALYLGQAEAPSTLPALPDVTYRWAAGTPAASMPGLLNAHLANDLLYLAQKPYVLTYQSSAQSGIANATWTQLVTGQVSGIVHGDAGDPWNGWTSGTSNAWTAPRSGWYLVCQEFFMDTPTINGGTTIAGLACSQAGLVSPDQYQQMTSSTAFSGGGAAALGYYYLRAGDTIAPQIYSGGTTSTTTATIATAGSDSHFEAVWISE